MLNVHQVTGTLAAIFYCVDDDTAGGRILLSGTTGNNRQTQSRGCTLIKSDSNGEFVASITAGGSEVDKIRFNFNPNSERFIRKVFNTDPTLTNSGISTAKFPGTTTNINYFLGETFERHVNQTDFAELAITGTVQTAGTLLALSCRSATIKTPNKSKQINDRQPLRLQLVGTSHRI